MVGPPLLSVSFRKARNSLYDELLSEGCKYCYKDDGKQQIATTARKVNKQRLRFMQGTLWHVHNYELMCNTALGYLGFSACYS